MRAASCKSGVEYASHFSENESKKFRLPPFQAKARLRPCEATAAHAQPLASPPAASSSPCPEEVETAQISYPTTTTSIGHRHPHHHHHHASSPAWSPTSSSWVLISVVVAMVALASLPDGAGAHAIRRGHSSSTGESRPRSLAALALATGDALPRVHFRSRLGSRRAKHYRRRAPRNLNTCGNEPEGTPVSDLQ